MASRTFKKPILPMEGATAQTAGTEGLVPAPTTNDVGKYLKGNGSWDTVPSYESKAAASGGTDVSLVTTGEKYTWNSIVSDDKTWNDVELLKQQMVSNGDTSYVPLSLSTSPKNMSFTPVKKTPTASAIAKYDADSYLSSTTPSANDNSTKVATTAYVDSALTGKLDSSLKGAASGLAELDSSGKVPSSQLPSYVDDVEEYASLSNFPATGESGKIYIALDTNITYRWGGSSYVPIGSDLALGETSTTAYRGDRGKTAYDHATDSSRLTTATSSGLYKVAITAEGHIASATAVQKSDITALGIPGSDTNTHRPIEVNGTQILGDNTTALNLAAGSNVTVTNSSGTVTIAATDTTYSDATQSASGLMSSADKTKLDGIASGATANIGTITGITMNGASKGTSGVVDLGTVITSHQDITGKADKVTSATNGNFAALDSNGNLTDSGHKHSDYLTSHQDISGKADKVASATSGNFAALDSNGNLTDSGSKASDFLTSHQDISGKADKVSNATSGNFAGLDANGNLTDSGSKASDFLTQHQDITGKADKDTDAVVGNFAYFDANGNPVDSGHKHADYLTSHQDITGKADKVAGATTGNFAGLDAYGNITDSGSKASDFLTQHQDISGKANRDTDAVEGNFASFDSTGNPVDSGHKHSDYLTSHQDISGKADKVQSGTAGNFAGIDSNGNLTDSGSKASDFLTSHQDISGKTDKVSGATSGNFAGLDAYGNLTDSGSKASDFLTSHQDITGKADKVTGATSGNFAGLDSNGNITDSGSKASDFLTQHQDISGKLDASEKGEANGVAELDSTGKVPTSQLPSYVDDVLEYSSQSAFPETGETGKIYVALDINLTYRWSGSAYVEISPSLALGETSSTAYRGDRGKAAYDHATDSGRLTTAQTSGLYKIATTAEGHVAGVTAVQKSDITELGIPAQDTTYSAFTGANGTTAGTSGLVPAPAATDDTKYLKGDGTWGTVSLPADMTGATSSAAGAHGLVPAPASGDNEKFLRGDGTWAEASDGGEINTVAFSIATTDWTLSSGSYMASISNSGFDNSTTEVVQYDVSILNLNSGLTVTKDGTTYDAVFTTKNLPSGTITGTILSFNSTLANATGVNF